MLTQHEVQVFFTGFRKSLAADPAADEMNQGVDMAKSGRDGLGCDLNRLPIPQVNNGSEESVVWQIRVANEGIQFMLIVIEQRQPMAAFGKSSRSLAAERAGRGTAGRERALVLFHRSAPPRRAVPASSVMDLASAREIRVLEFPDDKFKALQQINKGYDKRIIKAGSYPKQDKDVKVIGYDVVSKTTGCEAMFLHAHALGAMREMFLFRPYDKATIWEQRDVVRLADRPAVVTPDLAAGAKIGKSIIERTARLFETEDRKAARREAVYLPLLRGQTPRALEVFDFAEQGG